MFIFKCHLCCYPDSLVLITVILRCVFETLVNLIKMLAVQVSLHLSSCYIKSSADPHSYLATNCSSLFKWFLKKHGRYLHFKIGKSTTQGKSVQDALVTSEIRKFVRIQIYLKFQLAENSWVCNLITQLCGPYNAKMVAGFKRYICPLENKLKRLVFECYESM